MSHSQNQNRSAFTLIELIVVIAIITLLMTLSAGALFKAYESVAHGATARTIQKITARLDRRIKHLQKELDKRTPSVYGMEISNWETRPVDKGGPRTDASSPAPVEPTVMSGGETDREYRRAKVIYFKYLMKWNFPMTYDEVRKNVRIANIGTPAEVIYGHPIAVALYTSLRDKIKKPPETTGNYNATTGACVANNTDRSQNYSFTESGACLAMVIELLGTLDDFGPNEVRDTDGDGVPEIVDAWGQPLRLYRWPKGFVDPLAAVSGETLNGTDQPNNRMSITFPLLKWFSDPEDPDSLLYIDDAPTQDAGGTITSLDPDRTWARTATTRTQFESTFHRLWRPATSTTYFCRPIYTQMVIASAGPGKRWGLGYTANTTVRTPDPSMRVFGYGGMTDTVGDVAWQNFDRTPGNSPVVPDGDLADDEYDNIYNFRLGLAVSGQ